MRSGNTFLYDVRTDLNSLFELMRMFTESHTKATQVMSAVDVSRRTAVEYWFMCRQVCTAILDKLPKFMGTDRVPMQMDMSYFSDRWKYNRSRMLKGDENDGGDDNNFDEPV